MLSTVAAPLLVVATRLPRINPAMRKKFSTGLSTPLVASVQYPLEWGLTFKPQGPCRTCPAGSPDRDLPAPAGLPSRPRYKWRRGADCDKHLADKGEAEQAAHPSGSASLKIIRELHGIAETCAQ